MGNKKLDELLINKYQHVFDGMNDRESDKYIAKMEKMDFNKIGLEVARGNEYLDKSERDRAVYELFLQHEVKFSNDSGFILHDDKTNYLLSDARLLNVINSSEEKDLTKEETAKRKYYF